MRVSESQDTKALQAAGLFDQRGVFVVLSRFHRGDGVVRIDESGPALIGRLPHKDGVWKFEPTGTLHVTFSPDQVQALHALLGLIHYDNLALEWRSMLPAELLAAGAAVSEATKE